MPKYLGSNPAYFCLTECICHFGPCVCDTESMMRNRADTRSVRVIAAHHTVKPPHTALAEAPKGERRTVTLDSWAIWG